MDFCSAAKQWDEEGRLGAANFFAGANQLVSLAFLSDMTICKNAKAGRVLAGAALAGRSRAGQNETIGEKMKIAVDSEGRLDYSPET